MRALWWRWCSFGAFVPISLYPYLTVYECASAKASASEENHHTRSQPQLTLTRLIHLINITHKQTNEQTKKAHISRLPTHRRHHHHQPQQQHRDKRATTENRKEEEEER